MFLLQPSQASSPVLRFGADGPVIDAQLSSDGATLMARCEDGSVNLWNAETGAWLTSLRSDSTKAVRALLSPKGSYLLVITDSAMVQIFDLKTATEQARFDGHQYTITASCFLHDESGVVTAAADGTIFIWPPRGDQVAIELKGQTGYPITAIDVLPDDSKIVTVSHMGRSIVVWDARSGLPIAFDKQNEENRPVQAVFDPSGTYLVVPTIYGNGETRVLEFSSVPLANVFESPRLFLHSLEGIAGRDPVPLLTVAHELEGEWGKEAVFSPDGRILAIRHQDSDIVLWDWATRQKLRTLRHGNEMITQMRFSPDSRYLLVAPGEPSNIIPDGGKWDAQIARVWDLADGSEAVVLQGHSNLVMSADFDTRGNKIVTGAKDGEVLIWSSNPEASNGSPGADNDTPVVRSLRADAAAVLVAAGNYAPILQHAAEQGRAAVIATLLAAGADAQATPENHLPPLHSAVWNGQVDAVKVLLENGADVNALDTKARTALHCAVIDGRKDLVDVLLGYNAARDMCSGDNGETALMQATEAGDLAIVEALLVHGARPDLRNRLEETALHVAARAGNDDIVTALLEGGASADLTDANGKSALELALLEGHRSIADSLLAKGAVLRVHSENPNADLYAAAKRGEHAAVVQQLLEQGAQPDVPVDQSITPLHLAAQNGFLPIVVAMVPKCTSINVQTSFGATPLYLAATSGHADVVNALLDAGADPLIENRQGDTALKAALSKGHDEAIDALQKRGAVFDVHSLEGVEALVAAAHGGLTLTVTRLLENGADPNARSAKDGVALSAAAAQGHAEIVAKLLAAGAEVDPNGSDGGTPLLLAVQAGRADVVAALLAAGADVNARNSDQVSALQFGAGAGHAECVDRLLAAGAEVNARSRGGYTALLSAAKAGHLDIVRQLLAHGADPSLAQNYGWAPLHSAAQQGHVEVVRLLLENGADPMQLTKADDPNSTAFGCIRSKNPEELFKLLVAARGL